MEIIGDLDGSLDSRKLALAGVLRGVDDRIRTGDRLDHKQVLCHRISRENLAISSAFSRPAGG
jgi:hypothetical protein